MIYEVEVGESYASKSGFIFKVIALARHAQDCSHAMVVYINIEPTNDSPIGTVWVISEQLFIKSFSGVAMAKTPEGIIQTYAQEQLKKRGCLVRKISYEGRRGCPDLLVLVPMRQPDFWSETLFLEIKKDEQTKPDPHQQREHERIRQHGGDVRVIGSKEQVDSLVNELFPTE